MPNQNKNHRPNNKKIRVNRNAYFNHPNNFGKEGTDHININIQSETRIGKLLDPAYLKVINYKYIGKFSSVMSLWYWVRSPDLDDNIRRLSGNRLKMYAEENKVFGNYVPNFKAIIAKATWIKVNSYPAIINEIKELPNDIKLLSYHIVRSSNVRICTNYANMIIEIMTEIIASIKEDREPNFDLFVDKENLSSLDYLEGVLCKIMSEEQLNELKQKHVNDDSEEDYELSVPDLDID